RAAMAAPIVGDHPMLPRQRRHHRAPHVGAGAGPVDEEHRGADAAHRVMKALHTQIIDSAGKKVRMLRCVLHRPVSLALAGAPPPSLARRETLAPLRYAAHRAAGRLDALADADALKRKWLGTLAENVGRMARAGEILDAAGAAGVTLMPFKGVLLAD